MPRLCSSLLLSLLIASSASGVTMDWTPIGNPGNPPDTQVMNDFTTGYGSVPYAYHIGTYEVTNAQYTEFLNVKAGSDPLGLYNTNMGDGFGGITRSGVSGSYTYSTIAGREHMPVNWVSFYDAVRFANWMNNGQGGADTETGAYTLLGGTPSPSNGTTVTRNAGATIVLTSEDEWYKAAYYDAASTSYNPYPFADGFNGVQCQPPAGTTTHSANCQNAALDLTTRGSYTDSTSQYGTFDQGGNVWEWNEAIISGSNRAIRGGAFFNNPPILAAAYRGYPFGAFSEAENFGFRLAMIPEPSTGVLVIVGLLGFGLRRRIVD